MPENKRIALLGLVIACVFWGIGFPLTKAFALRAQVEAPGASSWFVAAVLIVGRFLAAAAVVGVVDRRRPERLEWEQGGWLGIVTGLGVVLQTDGLSYTSASTSAFLTQGYVVVLPVVAGLGARRFPELRVLGAVMASVLGLAVLSGFSPSALALGRGEAETLGAAMLFTAQILVLSRKKYAANRANPVTFVFFLSVAITTFPLAVVTAQSGEFLALVRSSSLWGLGIALTLLGTLAPFWLMNQYQPQVPPAEAGVIYGAEPVFASLFALWVPAQITSLAGSRYANETITTRLLLGGALVTVANLVLQLQKRSNREAPRSSPAVGSGGRRRGGSE